jgi:hypothetical protein
MMKAAKKVQVSDVDAVKDQLAKVLRGMKFKKFPDGWSATKVISEKRRLEQSRFQHAWEEKVKALLGKKPWHSSGCERRGWNGQYDVGGNYANDTCAFVNLSTFVQVTLTYHHSFRTGTKEWFITIKDIG